MSLNDRYHRDEGRIQRMDRRFTEIGDRFGNYWTETTGITRSTLTRSLYFVSIVAAVQHYLLYHEFPVLLLCLFAVLSMNAGTISRGGIVEQIQSEAAGLPRNTVAFFRLMILLIGVFNLMGASTRLIAMEFSPDVVAAGVGSDLLVGIAMVALQFSEYIRRTNPTNRHPGGRRPGKLVRSTAPSR
jgi:hypothetical protein